MSTCRFPLVAAVLIAMLFASGCASKKGKDEAQLHARIGTALLQQGHYPDALRELLEAEKLDPRNAMVQNNLGLVYFMRQKYKLAFEHITHALEIEPKYSEARNNRARVLIELGRYDEAVADLRIVINDLTYKDPSKAIVNLGLAYFKKGDFVQARSTFAKAIAANRENCLAQTLYGRSLFELGQFTLAASSLDNATVICQTTNDKGFDEPQYYSGLAYYKLGNSSSAISRMEEIVKHYPDGQYAHKAEDLLKLMK